MIRFDKLNQLFRGSQKNEFFCEPFLTLVVKIGEPGSPGSNGG